MFYIILFLLFIYLLFGGNWTHQINTEQLFVVVIEKWYGNAVRANYFLFKLLAEFQKTSYF